MPEVQGKGFEHLKREKTFIGLDSLLFRLPEAGMGKKLCHAIIWKGRRMHPERL